MARLARGLLPGLPIVVYSGAGGRHAGEGTLYDLYLSKPFHGRTLLAAMAGLLARPAD